MTAIYARQSVDKKDSISIETQIDFCKREADGAECSVYFDKGYSGSNTQRPEFQRLLSDVRDGKIDRIITYRLDRISRSVLDFANLIDMFSKHNVSFNSTQERFDTGTPMGKAMLNIAMVFAQLERETIQARIKDNYYARGSKGMYLGGPPPFGFSKVETHTEHGTLKILEVNPLTAPILIAMFEQYAIRGLSLGAISKDLNERNIPSPNGEARWDSGKVSRVLRNPAAVIGDSNVYLYYQARGVIFTNEPGEYASGSGCYLYGRRSGNERKYTDVSAHTLSLAPHPGIVPSDVFLSAQRRLDGNSQIDNRRRSEITWLTGLVKCANCGYSVIPKSSNNARYTYLYCSGRINLNGCTTASNLGKLAEVEELVRQSIFTWSEYYHDLKATLESRKSKDSERIHCRLVELDNAAQRLLELAIDSSEVSAQYIHTKLDEVALERQALSAELSALQTDSDTIGVKYVSDLRNEWEHLDIHAKHEIAALLIERIDLAPDSIEVTWAYNFAA